MSEFNQQINQENLSRQNNQDLQDTYNSLYGDNLGNQTQTEQQIVSYPSFSNQNLDGDHAKPRKQGGFFRWLLSMIVLVAGIFGLAYLLNTFVIQPYEIPSGSMETTIMTGDKVMAEKVSYRFSEPKSGDIITFEDPQIPSRTLIKRIVAVGGQTIDLVDGNVIVDGSVLNEPYTNGQKTYELSPANNVRLSYPYTVPDGYVFVMGDNRGNSQDSRYFGAIKTSTIEGHAFLVYWPFNHFGNL